MLRRGTTNVLWENERFRRPCGALRRGDADAAHTASASPCRTQTQNGDGFYN